MQFEFNFAPERPTGRQGIRSVSDVPIELVRHPRARRYVLRLRADGSARVTIPRGGSVAEARRFVGRQKIWLERQLQRLLARPVLPREWGFGSNILFRGERLKLEPIANGKNGMVRFGTQQLGLSGSPTDLRPAIERYLWRLAAKELPTRVFEYSKLHQIPIRRVTVRNQRSRWGSCSRRGTISLNWRLIQAPAFVRDYIILHELCHVRQMNHSRRFWQEVKRVCPDFQTAERWLKQNSSLLK
jgi:predicted metal-dependent hydrolase